MKETNVNVKKKSTAKRALILSGAILLLLAIIITVVFGGLWRAPALSLEGVRIDREMYAFWFSMGKTDMMRRYGIKSTQDTSAFWASPCGLEEHAGKTWGEVLDADVHRAIKTKLCAAMLYDSLGLSMTRGQKKVVDDYYNDMLEYVADGEKSALREELARYGTTPAALRRCASFDLKAELVLSYLERNGESVLTAEEKAGFYHDNYYRVKIVYINNDVYGRYEDGVRIEEPLNFSGPGAQNDKDKRELAEILDAYKEGAALPADFSARFDAYLGRSDEGLHGDGAYPSGIYVTRTVDLSENGFLEPEVAEAARGLLPGQLAHVSTANGERYIYGYALDTAAYDRKESAPFFRDFYSRAASRALTARALARIGDVKEYPENYKDISVTSIPCNLDFKLCTVD